MSFESVLSLTVSILAIVIGLIMIVFSKFFLGIINTGGSVLRIQYSQNYVRFAGLMTLIIGIILMIFSFLQ